jgi:hypothetical protein
MLPSFYHEILQKYLTPAQLLTLQMLVWLLQTQKEVRIERLAATLQLPILQSSRRRHIQRFLQIKALSILVIWFPLGETGDIPSNRGWESISHCIG